MLRRESEDLKDKTGIVPTVDTKLWIIGVYLKAHQMKKLLVSMFLLLLLPQVYAQQDLSLEDCRNLAIENNKRLKIADEQIKASEAKKKEAFTKYLPALDGVAAYTRNQKEMNLLSEDAHLPILNFTPEGYKPGIVTGADGRPVAGPDGKPLFQQLALLPKEAMTIDTRNVGLLQVGLTQPIYMGGKIRAYNQLAGLSEKLAHTNRAQELQNVILSVDEAYWQVVSLVNRGKLADKYVETLQKFEHNITLMHTTGVATKSDVLSVRVKLNEAEMVQTKVQDGLSLSRMLLNQLCGLPADTLFSLKEEAVGRMPLEDATEVSLEQVYSNRPEITSLTLATEIYKKKEKIARSEYLPNLAFMANWMGSTPSFFDGISTNFDGMWSVGIGLKAPIFHWGASRKSVRYARSQTEIVNYQLQETKEKIELQVSQSQFKLKEVAKKMEMASRSMERAEENLRYANLGFQEGTIPVLNVLEAQTAWLSAHSNLIDAQIDARLCRVYLQKAYGTLGTAPQ